MFYFDPDGLVFGGVELSELRFTTGAERSFPSGKMPFCNFSRQFMLQHKRFELATCWGLPDFVPVQNRPLLVRHHRNKHVRASRLDKILSRYCLQLDNDSAGHVEQ